MSKQSHNFKFGDRAELTEDIYHPDGIHEAGHAGDVVHVEHDGGCWIHIDTPCKTNAPIRVSSCVLKPESTTTPITEQEFKIRFYPTPASDFHGLERNRENLIKATVHSLNKWTGLDGVDFKQHYRSHTACSLCVIQSVRVSGDSPDCSTCPIVLSGHVKCCNSDSAYSHSRLEDKSTQPMQDALRKSLHWLMDESNSLEPVISKVVDVWPARGEIYWFIDGNGRIHAIDYDGTGADIKRVELGNCYRTREEAELVLKRRKLIVRYEALCKRLWDERGEVIDWSNAAQAKRCYEVTAVGRKMNNAFCTAQTLPSSRYLPDDDNHGFDSNNRVRKDFSYDELYLIHTGEER